MATERGDAPGRGARKQGARNALRRAAAALALLAGWAGCTPDPVLEHEDEPEPVVRRENGLMRTLRGRVRPPEAVAGSPEAVADWFVERVADDLALRFPARELRRVGTDVRDDGRLHTVRYERVAEGLPVFGSFVLVQVDEAGDVVFASARVPAHVPETLQPSVPATRAAEVAAREAGGSATETTLGIYDPDVFGLGTDPARLAWRVRLEGPDAPGSPEVYVDAQDERVLLRFERRQTGFEATVHEYWPNLEEDPVPAGANSFCTTLLRAEGRDARSREGAWGPRLALATRAERMARLPYDFYDSLGRDSYDGRGGPLRICIGMKNVAMARRPNCPNAAWYGEGWMLFCDPLLVDDVMVHEFTHGVVEHSARLVYVAQPGALNESFADVMAAFATSGSDKWLIGEDIPWGEMPCVPLRDMGDPANPTAGLAGCGQPGHMRDYDPTPRDNHGVHANSGIPNLAAYRAAHGGELTTVDGRNVRWEALPEPLLERLYYDVLTLSLGPTSSFLDARDALVRTIRGYAESRRNGTASRGRAATFRQCGAVINALASVGLGSPDRDNDCVPDAEDVCPEVYNPEQLWASPRQAAGACGGGDAGAGDDPCLDARSCSECTARAECGWCEEAGACLRKGEGGARPASCPAEAWETDALNCGWFAPPCEEQRDCVSCLSVEGCGYCGATGVCLPKGIVESGMERCESGWTTEWRPTDTPPAPRDGGAGGGADGGVPADGGASSEGGVSAAAAVCCKRPGSSCGVDAECCADPARELPGLCVEGTCRIAGECVPKDTACAPGDTWAPCCSGTVCRRRSTSADAPYACCVERDDRCTSSAECCGTMECRDGVCACMSLARPCLQDEDCCSGLGCVLGECKPIAGCARVGRLCGNRGDCCGEASCLPPTAADGRAGVRTCCAGKQRPCHTDAECCGEMLCVFDPLVDATRKTCQCRRSGWSCVSSSECCRGLACRDGTCQ